ncbi:MAG: dTMP kinase [Deltaproteobacteria bacterium CG11_big_fil_rev_8_21_14_0_20_47_16]|nr:MAG: dTMP kinase [Deltaproteobacteria bacterium CG11_big_fil_rev_8_21_14_0_20_47_16]
MSGLFITFEGVEGCGKSTQVRLLVDALEAAGHSVHVTREPGGTPIGEDIRSILLSPANKVMCKEAEILLYAAARAQHVAEVIRPKMAEGTIVISDRYADATAAYQGAARGFSPEQLAAVHKLATNDLQPDATILIDVPVAKGLARVLQRSIDEGRRGYDRLEAEALEFHEAVQAAYLKLAKANPKRIHVMDGMQSIDDIHQQIMAVILPLCGTK